MNLIQCSADVSFNTHLFIAAFVRFIFILYSNYHDDNYIFPFTDIDYKVFTDAARHVLNGQSPYKRHTYRYSPIISYLMVPNIVINRNFGKIVFCAFDLLVGITVKRFVEFKLAKDPAMKNKDWRGVAKFSSLFWLYNPLSITISTRGNADSFPCLFVIISVYLLQSDQVKSHLKYVLSGLILGLSIHLRLYPLVFSFPMYLSLGEYNFSRDTKTSDCLLSLLPNRKQILLTASCIASLTLLTYSMYYIYGYEFLFESYIYHLFRKDSKHNFSVLFYYSYLTVDELNFDLVKMVCLVFVVLILFVLSLSFGTDPNKLPFALFCQAIILVTYSSVVTSQYFVWYLTLLPLIAHDLKMGSTKSYSLIKLWLAAQALWLLGAYFLEFKTWQMFPIVWVNCIVLFATNIYVLGSLIKGYNPCHCYGSLFNVK